MNFEKGPSPEEIKKAEERGSEKLYHEKVTINGVEIIVDWYDDTADYNIFFPQINFEVAREKGIFDQVIRLSKKPELAKKVFEFAANLAKSESDVYKIYSQVEDFARKLDDEE